MSDPLDTMVELFIDGAWTDVTADVFTREEIEIKRGRSDEGSKVDRGTCSLTLNNRNGVYSPRNPNSPHFQKIGRNTPLRVNLSQAEYAADDGGSLNDTTLHIAPTVTADRAGLLLCGWGAPQPAGTYTIPASMNTKGQTTDASSTFATARQTIGAGATGTRTATFNVAEDYVSASVAAYGDAVTVDQLETAADGSLTVGAGLAGAQLVMFLYQAWDGDPALLLADPTGGAVAWSTLADTGTFEPVDLDADNMRMRVLAGRVSGNTEQTITIDVTDAGALAGLYILSGADPLTEDIRFVGEVSEWPQRWDMSGTDIEAPIEASGVLRRLGAGRAINSALYRFNVTLATVSQPLAYWPCEDGADADRIANPVQPTNRMVYRLGREFLGGDPAAEVDFGSDAGPAGSDGGIVLPPGWEVVGRVPIQSASAFTIEFWVVFTNDSQSVRTHAITNVGGGRITDWEFQLSSTTEALLGHDEDNTTSDPTSLGGAASNPGLGVHHVAWTMEQIGADFRARVWLDGQLHHTFTPSDSTEPINTLSRIIIENEDTTNNAGMYLSHIAVWPFVFRRLSPSIGTTELDLALRVTAGAGHAGETAAARIGRLCAEENVTVTVLGDPDDTVLVGPQLPGRLLDLLHEAAEADGGILYETRSQLGLTYRTRNTLFNTVPVLELDYDAGDLTVIEPTDDDQGIRNDVTVTRQGGSSARYVLEDGPLSVLPPPDGVGRYDDSVTLSLYSEERLVDHAGWMVHLGTVDEFRYPQLQVKLGAANFTEGSALTAAARALDVGDRLTVTNLPDWLPPEDISQLAQGFTETLGTHFHDIAVNCSPESPWRVGVLEDEVLGRLDTDGCTLDTDLFGALNPNPGFETNTTGWGNVNSTFVRSEDFAYRGDASGKLTPDGVAGAAVAQTLLADSPAVTAGLDYEMSGRVYSPTGYDQVRVFVTWYDAGDVEISTIFADIVDVPAGEWTRLTLTETAPALAVKAQLRFREQNTPPATAVLYIDEATILPVQVLVFTAAGPVWTEDPAEFPFDVMVGGELMTVTAVTTEDPFFPEIQTMTVQRAGNGIHKTHPGGADIRLAHPLILSI